MSDMTTAPETNESAHLIASNKVEGTPVYTSQGERIGSIYNFMVEKRSGKVAYAVMSFGGFLGMGESYHPLPWNKLTYDTSLGGYVVGVTRERLQAAPAVHFVLGKIRARLCRRRSAPDN